MPAARSVLGSTEYPLLLETSFFERALLSHVVNIGLCLNAFDRRRRKEVRDKNALGLAAESMSPCLWNQAYSDVPRNRLWIRTMADFMPGDRADWLAIRYTFDDQGSTLAINQSVLQNAWPDWPSRNTEVVEFAAVLVGLPEFQEFGVIQRGWPQANLVAAARKFVEGSHELDSP